MHIGLLELIIVLALVAVVAKLIARIKSRRMVLALVAVPAVLLVAALATYRLSAVPSQAVLINTYDAPAVLIDNYNAPAVIPQQPCGELDWWSDGILDGQEATAAVVKLSHAAELSPPAEPAGALTALVRAVWVAAAAAGPTVEAEAAASPDRHPALPANEQDTDDEQASQPGAKPAESARPAADDSPAVAAAPPVATSRPSWVRAKPHRAGGVYEYPVAIGPYTSREEIDAQKPVALAAAVDQYTTTLLGPAARGRLRFTSDEVRTRFQKGEWEESRQHTFGDVTAEMLTLHVLLEFDREDNAYLRAQWRQVLANERAVGVGVVGGGVLLILVLVYGGLKFSLVRQRRRKELAMRAEAERLVARAAGLGGARDLGPERGALANRGFGGWWRSRFRVLYMIIVACVVIAGVLSAALQTMGGDMPDLPFAFNLAILFPAFLILDAAARRQYLACALAAAVLPLFTLATMAIWHQHPLPALCIALAGIYALGSLAVTAAARGLAGPADTMEQLPAAA